MLDRDSVLQPRNDDPVGITVFFNNLLDGFYDLDIGARHHHNGSIF